MKRAQLYLKNASDGLHGLRECPQDAQRQLAPQLNSVGWAEARDALQVAVLQDRVPPPREPEPGLEPETELSRAARVYRQYFGCPVPSDRASSIRDRAAERRRAWEEAVVARHLLPETGAELLVLEGIKHTQ